MANTENKPKGFDPANAPVTGTSEAVQTILANIRK